MGRPSFTLGQKTVSTFFNYSAFFGDTIIQTNYNKLFFGESVGRVGVGKKGHKFVTLLQINAHKVMSLSQKLGKFI